MGTRSHYESVTRVVQAFVARSTWTQAELARQIGVESRAVKRLLASLAASGMPLERDEDHPHVFWSVPKKWFPGGVFFDEEDWEVLVHVVLLIKDERRRTKLMGRLLSGRNLVDGAERLTLGVVGTVLTSEEQETVLLVERSFLEDRPLHIRYFSGSSGQLRDRLISPQRLVTEPRSRLAAYCHENNELRWFRIDNIERAGIEPNTKRHAVDQYKVDSFVASSVDGFQDGSEVELAFVVDGPATNWVRGNLLPGMRVESQSGKKLRVVANGGAVVVARFVAGLGGAAVAEGAALRQLVRDTAQKSIKAHQDEGV